MVQIQKLVNVENCSNSKIIKFKIGQIQENKLRTVRFKRCSGLKRKKVKKKNEKEKEKEKEKTKKKKKRRSITIADMGWPIRKAAVG
jgi:hypothetical protein